MQQSVYSIKRISSIGVGVVTFLSIASMSSTLPYSNDTLTSSINTPFVYEGTPLFSDKEGEFCVSSPLLEMVRGDVLTTENNLYALSSTHEKFSVQLKILEVKQHKSKFDFEDDYEEI